MPLSERTYKHVNTSRNPAAISNMEQYLRGGAQSSRISPTYSPTSPSSPYFERVKHHDPEEDHALYQKKSVLAKVKEKARRLRTSLSMKKQDDGNFTPSWGVSLEDAEGEEEQEEDAEYLGAPIYESELAPEDYKENARQHPRENPVISEKQVLRNSFKSGVEQDQDMLNSPAMSTTIPQPATTTTHGGPNSTITEKIVEKLTPANAKGSDAAHSTSSNTNAVSGTPSVSFQNSQASSGSPAQSSSSSSCPLGEKNTSSEAAPMKDYLMNKFEASSYEETHSMVKPETVSHRRDSSNAGVLDKVKGAVSSLLRNEDSSRTEYSSPKQNSSSSSLPNSGNGEKTQSQVTSETMNHRRGPSNGGVIEKFKGAVNSLLWNEEPSKQCAAKTSATSATSQITNNQEVGQEEKHGRDLQEN